MNQWLLQGNHPANQPPPYDRTALRQNFPSSAPIGVVAKSGSSRGFPRHVRKNLECEQKFKRLPFTAIPGRGAGMGRRQARPRPLQNRAEWPRGRARRDRFNPHSVEKDGGESPPSISVEEIPATESAPASTADEGGGAVWAPAVASERTTATIPNEGATREDVAKASPTEERPPFFSDWAGDSPHLGREDRAIGSRTCAGARPVEIYSGVSAPYRETDVIHPAAHALTAGRLVTRDLIVVNPPACFVVIAAAGEPR